MASASSLAGGMHGRVFTSEVMAWRAMGVRKSLVQAALWRQDGRRMRLDTEKLGCIPETEEANRLVSEQSIG